ncbi:MAG: PAS domain-containing protein [Proteobacteria bacterium]|nr:PAS domain-containing protein [Pseudomonadota bacterium]
MASTILDERLMALLRLWETKCAGRRMPARADFAFGELRPWVGHLMILDTIADGSDFRYALFGTAIAHIFGFDLTGRTVSTCEAEIGPLALEEYRRVCETGQPSLISRLGHLVPGKDHFAITKLALPLSGDGVVVDKILVALYTNLDSPARPRTNLL